MEFVRYVIAFFVIGWGGPIIATILFVAVSPLVGALRNTDPGRAIAAVTNGAGVLGAIFAFSVICRWTGGEAKLSMLALPLLLTLKNNIWRIRRAQVADAVPGLELSNDPDLRSGVVRTERMNLVADVTAFALGIFIVGIPNGGPDLAVKRLVSRCVQEPMVVVQDYYSRPHVVPGVLSRAPVSHVFETARRNRTLELSELSGEHRVLVEARMEELARWIDMNTTVTAKGPAGPFVGVGGGVTTVELPDSEAVNSKARALCVELFETW